MTSEASYCVLVIKPMTIGRDEGPLVLKDLLSTGDFQIVRMMPSNVCRNTWLALEDISRGTESEFSFGSFITNTTARDRVSWVMIIKHRDGITDPTDLLNKHLGPTDPSKWTYSHLRLKYARLGNRSLDDVTFVSPKGKANLTAMILIKDFKEEEL
jgi:hypothetical protein